ncbi:hypothetical protein [Capnocytophaga stomatis]|uniref:DUF3828 domain-containing protein n=1 Tax=Capnocytophaga stomatis TaxID=1848904 RepID=A0ABW8Q827_9FLAO|nr:hypothetical protein [Capnocytophaga stomatis]GIJ93143.1 hypothetical protein CAPN002_03610 [Capnocytophaga stomatis]
MKKLILMLTFVALIACKQQSKGGKATGNESKNTAQSVQNDSLALLNLTRNAYKWLENEYSYEDFIPTADPNDTLFNGIDFAIHDAQIHKLEKSGFFGRDLINLYDEIGQNIDFALREHHVKWAVGDISPFSRGTNDWCMCQDIPSPDYYERMTIENIKIKDDVANFQWQWGEPSWGDFTYKVRAKKEDGKWKISWLEGFEETNEWLRDMVLNGKN